MFMCKQRWSYAAPRLTSYKLPPFQMGKKQLKDPKEAADIATAEMLRRTHHSRAWYRVIAGRANKGGSKVPFYNKPKVGTHWFK